MLGGGLIGQSMCIRICILVILIILGHAVRGTYIIRDVAVPDDDGKSLMHQSFIGFGSYVDGLGDDHINSPHHIFGGE